MIDLRAPYNMDINFIYDSWLHNYRKSPSSTHIHSNTYYPEQRQIIEDLLLTASTIVACNPDNDEQIYGYIVFKRPNTLHYVLVKHIYRRMGVCRKLMEAAFPEAILNDKPIYATHSTTKLRRLSTPFHVIYDERLL